MLASLGALADVPWVEGDLVTIFAALIARLGGVVLGEVAGGVGTVNAAVAALGLCAGSGTPSSGAATAPTSRQAGCGGHCVVVYEEVATSRRVGKGRNSEPLEIGRAGAAADVCGSGKDGIRVSTRRAIAMRKPRVGLECC